MFINEVDKFSNTYISDIAQDSKGFIWLGTQDGLIRYDGHTIYNLRYTPDSTNSLSANWIKAIDIAENDKFYLGTQGGGLNVLTLADMSFVNSAHSDLGMLIETATPLSDGVLAVQSENGVFVISKDEIEKQIPIKGYLKLLMNQSTNIWLSENNTLIHYDTVGEKVLSTAEFDSRILALIAISNSKFLVATETGLFEFEPNTSKSNLVSEAIVFGGISHQDVTHLYSKHNLFQYHSETKTLQKLNSNTDFLNSEINTLFKDRQGVLWIGTDKGLFKEQKTAAAFISLKALNHHARRILKYQKRMYLGGKEGLFMVNENNEQQQLLKDVNIRSLDTVDSKVWAGGINGDFYSIDSNLNIEKHVLEPNGAEGLVIYGFKQDQKQRVWASTWRGFYILDTEANIINRKVRIDDNVKISHSHLDKKDRLWVSTVDNGIYKIEDISKVDLNNSSIKFDHYVVQPKNSNSLISNIVIAIEEDKNGNMWFGTDSGIVSFNESTNNFDRLQFSGSVFNQKIMSLKTDARNDLWITTINKGIYLYSISEKYWIHFTKNDGLVSNSFLYTSGFFDVQKNHMFFGTDHGVQSILPDLVICAPNIFEPQITQVDLANGSEANIHPFQAPFLNEIDLQYTQNDFVLHFSSLDFVNEEKLNYAYKLDNFSWKSSKLPYVYFTNIAYGSHQLQLKVIGTSDSEYNANSKIKSLRFKIIPPWYRTWWAYVVYSSIFMLGIFFITRLIVNKKVATAQMKSIAAMDAIKSKMYANISHEIRTPVTVINGLSQLVLKESEDLERTTNVQGILKSSNQLLNLVNEMLELVSLDANQVEVNYKNGDVIKFIGQCIELYQPLANSNAQKLTLNSSISKLQMDIDDHKLQKILNNLLSNALKFTPDNGTVTVNVSKDNENLIIEVADTGKGIKKEELPMVFDRYYKTFDKNDNLGSGIGMALTKELVELLKGRIKVDSEINKGTTFTIYLPITNTITQMTEFSYQSPFVEDVSRSDKKNSNHHITPSKHSILVVEDSSEIRDYLEDLLGAIYNITTAENGKVAIDLVNNNEFDLIISDLQMPEIDGYAFCQSLKNDINSSHIPFIVLTARTETKDKVKGYDMGIDAYITKPFNAEELLGIIKNLISKRLEQIDYFNKLLHLKNIPTESLNLNQLDVELIKKLQEIILDKTQSTSIEFLTQTLLISKSQLHRKVKALTGMSVSQYVNHIKVEKAKDLLLNSELNINEIAYEVGYEDPKYFSRVFKKTIEVSPDQFRKQV